MVEKKKNSRCFGKNEIMPVDFERKKGQMLAKPTNLISE